MNNIFLCTNVNQLVAYKLISESRLKTNIPLVKNINILMINKYCNEESKNKIKIYSKKLNYKGVYSSSKSLFRSENNTKKVLLISRRSSSTEELLSILKYYKPVKYITIEDGAHENIRENFNHKLPFLFKIRESKKKVKRFFSLVMKSIIKSSKYWYLLKLVYFDNKALNLIVNTPSAYDQFCICYKNYFNIDRSSINIIVVGSIYVNLDRNKNLVYAKYIYKRIQSEFLKRGVKGKNILYAPHPRGDSSVAKFVSDNLKWIVDEKINSVEEAICFFNEAEVWSTGSSSQIYALSILKRNCIVISSKLLFDDSDHAAKTLKIQGDYLVSLGAEVFSLD